MSESDKQQDSQAQAKHAKRCGGGGSSGDMLYALGIFGASVYFWQGAQSNQDRAVAVLKGLAWPAFMVYEAFTILGSRPE